jgi:Tol biopolymer transport system component
LASTCVLVLGTMTAAGMPTAGATPDRAHARNGKILFIEHPDEDFTPTATINPDGSDQRIIADYGGGGRWAPNGRSIAIAGCPAADVDTCVTTIVDPTGRIRRELPRPKAFTPAGSSFFAPVVWSPDGSRLAGGAEIQERAGLSGIYTIRSSDGRGLSRVTTDVGGDVDEVGSYSPNGKRIAFSRQSPVADDYVVIGLFTIRLDGTGMRRLTPPGMELNAPPDWSPTGNRVVFDARPAPGHRLAIWIVRSNGTGMHQVPIPLPCGGAIDDPASFGCFHPTWSPDGRRIAFGSVDAATGEVSIYTVDRRGHHLARVTDGTTPSSVPDWGRRPGR